MNATHEDWVEAKRKRDNAAFFLAKAYIAGQLDITCTEAGKFAAADKDMERIEKELDGRADK